MRKDVRTELSKVSVKMAMSILKYFKRTNASNNTVSPTSSAALPDPEGPLISSIPTGAIASAKKKVTEGTARKPHRGPYHMLADGQRLMVVCQAAEYGTTTAIRYFAEK